MGKEGMRRLTPEEKAKDERMFEAMKRLAKYMPPDVALAIEALQAPFDSMRAAQSAEEQINKELAELREQAARAQRAFHKAIRGAKAEVKAQFGEDSEEARAVGIKKTSPRKSTSSRPRTRSSKRKN